MSPLTMFRTATAALLVLAVVPLVTFFAVGYLIPIAALIAALVLAGRRPRAAAGLSATAAALLGGGVLWAGWILGVIINGDRLDGSGLALSVAIPVVSVVCLVAALRVWRASSRTPATV
jgi:hypothetical protein